MDYPKQRQTREGGRLLVMFGVVMIFLIGATAQARTVSLQSGSTTVNLKVPGKCSWKAAFKSTIEVIVSSTNMGWEFEVELYGRGAASDVLLASHTQVVNSIGSAIAYTFLDTVKPMQFRSNKKFSLYFKVTMNPDRKLTRTVISNKNKPLEIQCDGV